MRGKEVLVGKAGKVQPRLAWMIWGLLLLLLPITSLPLLADIAGGSTVNPAAAIPLVLLVPLWLIPYFIRRGTLRLETLPLFGFIATALIASLIAYFAPILPWKGQTVLSRELRSWLTLATGIAFYLVTLTIVRDEAKLKQTIRLINLGAAIMLLWALVQGGFILLRSGNFPPIVRRVHEFISIRDISQNQITGFAYEASWFAHQLNILYFPLWLGTMISMNSLHKWRIGRYLPEMMLFLVGVVTLFFSRSRIGLIGFLLIIGILVLRFVFRHMIRIQAWIRRNIFKRTPLLSRIVSTLLSILLIVIILALFLGLSVGVIYLGSKIDPRLERIFMIDWPETTPLTLSAILDQIHARLNAEFANFLMFAERSVYWSAAFRVYNEHPLLGVGLGNAGFFFLGNMPAFSWSLPEVVDVLRDGTSMFPNPKNLWLRLLTETGIVGFTFFIVWILCVFSRAWKLSSDRSPYFKAVGLAGILGCAVLLVEGFSIDTFGLPYMWILFGLVSACARIASAKQEQFGFVNETLDLGTPSTVI